MTTRRPGAFRGADGDLALVVPILADEETVGVLQFLLPDHREPDAEVLETLALVGTELGTVVSRSRGAVAIAEMEATFRALVRESSELLMVVDEDLVAHTPYPTAALGAPSHRQPTPLKDLLHPDDYEGVISTLAFARLNPGAGQHFRCRIRAGDGSWHAMEGMATSVFEHGGRPQLVLNARDVSDQPLTHGKTGVIENRTTAPRRYELFGWDPAEPAPSLDQFLRHGGTATVGKDLGRLLAETYHTLAGVLQARSGQDAPQE
jgi:PAS domain-containing protein